MATKKKRKVFITGSSGFVGANLVRLLLKNNFSVHVIDRNKSTPWRLKDISDQITIHHGDLTDYSSLKRAIDNSEPEYIIHLAAYGAYHFQTELEKIVTVNVVGTENLLRASQDIPYKCLINTGSSSEYGFKNKPMKETDFCEPVSYYAATKLGATYLCKVFAKTNNKPVVTLRLFSVYGPYEEYTRLVPAATYALLKKRPINLSPGKQRRDFIYIDDVCQAYMVALSIGQKLSGEIINIGTGMEYTNEELVKVLFKATDQKTEINKGALPSRSWDTLHWRADTSHAEKILGCKATTPIDKGLKKTYSWFVKNHQLYQHFYEKK